MSSNEQKPKTRKDFATGWGFVCYDRQRRGISRKAVRAKKAAAKAAAEAQQEAQQ